MFQDINEIVGYAKKRAPLEQIVKAHLLNDKQEGRALLLEATVKAALAAALWNQTTALSEAVETVKAGKKTQTVKQWLKAATSLMGNLPINATGDIGRIDDSSTFVASVNEAITTWLASWASFEAAQAEKVAQRASKPLEVAAVAVTDTIATTSDTTIATTSDTTSDTTIAALQAALDAEQKAHEETKAALDAALQELATLKALPVPARKTRVKVTTP